MNKLNFEIKYQALVRKWAQRLGNILNENLVYVDAQSLEQLKCNVFSPLDFYRDASDCIIFTADYSNGE